MARQKTPESTGRAARTSGGAKKASTTRRTAANKSTAKKSAPAKTATKKATTKKAATKDAAKKTATKKSVAKKTPPAKKSSTTTSSTSTKTPAKKASTTKVSAKTPSQKTRSKAAALKVRADESPWTPEELEAVGTTLHDEETRLHRELTGIEHDIQQLMRDSGEGSGDDDVDAGAKTSEREQEFTVARNSKAVLEQVERALQAIDDGTYGICESCGKPIGKLRMQAQPRATLCVQCKQQQERR